MSEFDEFDDLLVDDQLPEGYRSGFIAVVGRPNVGKSTLINRLLGEKLAIVSPRPQTTRGNQLGIVTTASMQAILVDTPGIHQSRNALGDFMVSSASSTIRDADVVLFIVDSSRPPTDEDEIVAQQINAANAEQVILVLNKQDLLEPSLGSSHPSLEAYGQLVPNSLSIQISALQDTDVAPILALIEERLPEGPRYYPADQLTETMLRENASELIREQIMHQFEEEIPYAVAVKVEEFKERSADMTYIQATVYVERDSQKGIIIGKGGKTLKRVSQAARSQLEDMLGTRVYLELWVKVLKNWRKDPNALRRLGYSKKP